MIPKSGFLESSSRTIFLVEQTRCRTNGRCAAPPTIAPGFRAGGAISTGFGRGFAIWPRLRGHMPAQLVEATALDDIPARPPPVILERKEGQPDVDIVRPQGRSHQDLCDQGRRHWFAGGA